MASGDVLPTIWQVRDAIDEHIRTWRHVRAFGSENGQDQAPVAIAALQSLRQDLFGDVLGGDEMQAPGPSRWKGEAT